jgi:hypothetical protein
LNDGIASRSRQGRCGVTQCKKDHNHEGKRHGAIYDEAQDHTQRNFSGGILHLITCDCVSFPEEIIVRILSVLAD